MVFFIVSDEREYKVEIKLMLLEKLAAFGFSSQIIK